MGDLKKQSAGSLLLSYHSAQEQANKGLESKLTLEDLFAHGMNTGSETKIDAKGDGENVNKTWGSTQNTQLFGCLKYKMNHNKRGCFLIFSQENFDVEFNGKKLPSRDGTKLDAVNIAEAMKNLGFEYVNTFHDLRKMEIENWLEIVSKASHDEYDCFGCAILTHGGEGDILYAKDRAMTLDDFTEPFTSKRCSSLAGKPKLFFVQSCRGLKYDEGSELPRDLDVTDGPVEQPVEEEKPLMIPNAADFLLAYSTVPGYVAWLNSGNGSWFVQSLCHCINKFGDQLEIMQIMTRMNNMVAFQFESSTKDGNDHYKQMPSVCTRLTADLYFPRKQANGSPPENVDQGLTMTDEIEVHPQHVDETSQTPGPSAQQETKPKKKSLGSRIRKSFRLKRRGKQEK